MRTKLPCRVGIYWAATMPWRLRRIARAWLIVLPLERLLELLESHDG